LTSRRAAGLHSAAPAGFGPALTATGVSGVLAVPEPSDACEALVDPGSVAGRIALVDVANCEPTRKVRHAQDAGALGVIVVNDVDGVPDPMAGADETITIPSVIVPPQTGALLRGLANPPTVRLQLANVETSVRWLMGEDAVAFEGAIRDLAAPTCFGDPGKVSDPEYFCGSGDGGGVHYNSGVVNHGFALLVDGGHYNGRVIQGQGWARALAIYHRAMRVYQTPFTNFRDHADALEQSCEDLVGAPIFDPRTGQVSPQGVTAATCRAVTRVVQATELRREPTQCAFEPLLARETPPLCTQGEANPFFFEPFDAAPRGWSLRTDTVFDTAMAGGWTAEHAEVVETFGKRTGSFLSARTVEGNCGWEQGDASQVMWAETPALSVPAASPGATDGIVRLALEHLIASEPGYDGGNVAVRRNGGDWQPVTYEDFTFNGYVGYLYDFDSNLNTNPLQGQDSFTWFDPESAGNGSFGVSIADLKDLQPGDTFQLRFAYGQDGCNPDPYPGWILDAVQVYACQDVHKTAARMTSPAPGSVLPRGPVQFAWSPVEVDTHEPRFRLQVGTGPDGPWIFDGTTSVRRATVGLGGLAPGATVYVRLSTNVDKAFGASSESVYSVAPAP
jgi:hypothetical protein